jgi:hypothetical protein
MINTLRNSGVDRKLRAFDARGVISVTPVEFMGEKSGR